MPQPTFQQTSYEIPKSIDGTTGDNAGWALFDGRATNQTGVYQTASPLTASGLQFDLYQISNFAGHKIQSFRLSTTTDANPTSASGATWTQLVPTTAVTSAATDAAIQPNNSILITGPTDAIRAATDTYTVTVSTPVTNVTGFRLELFPVDGTIGFVAGGGNGNIVLSEFTVTAVPEPAGIATMGLVAVTAVARRRRR